MNSEPPFLSIVIPIYNVEQYLGRCLDSIINQPFSDWEIIAVNDCSPDDSQKIIDCYAKKDRRIKSVINKKNRGLGGARNVGVSYCKGTYILYIDSDDYITQGNELLEMCKQCRNNDLDILDTPYLIIHEGESVKQNPSNFNSLNERVLTGKQYLQDINILPVVAWNKMYKRSFIKTNSIRFKERKYEDICYTLEAIFKAKRVQNRNTPFYNYIIRSGSIMTSKPNDSSIKDSYTLCKDLENLYIECDRNSQIEKSFFYSFVGLANLLVEFEDSVLKRNFKKKLKSLHKQYSPSILKANKLGVKQKVLLFISPYLMSFVINKLKKT